MCASSQAEGPVHEVLIVLILLCVVFDPQVTFAYMKHLWHAGKKSQAFETLNHFVTLQARVGSIYSTTSGNGRNQEGPRDTAENDKLLARSAKEK